MLNLGEAFKNAKYEKGALLNRDDYLQAEFTRLRKVERDYNQLIRGAQLPENEAILRAGLLEHLKEFTNAADKHGYWLKTLVGKNWVYFSPEELRAQNAQGCFIWGARHWEFFDPKELLKDEQKELEKVRQHNEMILERIGKNTKGASGDGI